MLLEEFCYTSCTITIEHDSKLRFAILDQSAGTFLLRVERSKISGFVGLVKVSQSINPMDDGCFTPFDKSLMTLRILTSSVLVALGVVYPFSLLSSHQPYPDDPFVPEIAHI